MDFVNQEKRKQTNEEENPFENQKKIVRLSDVEIVFDNLPDDVIIYFLCLKNSSNLDIPFVYLDFRTRFPVSNSC